MSVRRRFLWRRKDGHSELTVESRDGRCVGVRDGSAETIADCLRLPDGRSSAILPSGRQLTGRAIARSDGRFEAWVGARRIRLDLADPLRELASESLSSAGGATEVRAQIPGRVVEVRVAAGDRVAAGVTLLVLEAMKMQNEIRAESAARVTAVECAAGQAVESGALLVRLEVEPVA